MSRIFVETTAQVTRLTGIPPVRAALERGLAGHAIITSSTVFLEFQRVVIEAHQRILPSLDDVPDNGNGLVRLADLYGTLANASQIRSDRQAKRVLTVVASIQRRFGDDPFVRVDDLRAFIKGEIRRFNQWRFFTFGYGADSIDINSTGGYLDGLECSVAADGFDSDTQKRHLISCNARTRECAIRSVVSSHREVLNTLARELRDADTKAANAAEKVAAFGPRELRGRKAVGQRLCWPLGDVLIALECPEDAFLLSSDHHFQVICAALNRSRLQFNYRTGEIDGAAVNALFRRRII